MTQKAEAETATFEVHRSESEITQTWISIEQLARYLGLSRRTIEDKILDGLATEEDGKRRIGGSVWFHLPTVEARAQAGLLFTGKTADAAKK